MIIDLKKLRTSGKTESSFCISYNPEGEEICSIPNANIAGDIKIVGEITLTGAHSAYIEGEVTFTVNGECTRCLTETEKTFVVDLYEEVEENNPDGYSVVCDKVDLKKIVNDLVTLNMPLNFLCKEDCKGICLQCGVNLNSEACKCNK